VGLLKIATAPPAIVTPTASVHDAVERMHAGNVGAVAVVEGDKLVGIFTERDVMNRVVRPRLDPDRTQVRQVMTPDVISARRDMPYGDALQMMVGKHFRHIPVVDEHMRVTGMLSVRDLYEHAVERLSEELNSVVSYFSADGPGGD
jgi:CBS domain-containing protein